MSKALFSINNDIRDDACGDGHPASPEDVKDIDGAQV